MRGPDAAVTELGLVYALINRPPATSSAAAGTPAEARIVVRRSPDAGGRADQGSAVGDDSAVGEVSRATRSSALGR